jgi:hypothetical protein
MRTVCALIAAAWFFAGLVVDLNPLVGFGFLALTFVDWAAIARDDLFRPGSTPGRRPDEPGRPADD